jgi:hypothetical protein
MHHVLSAPENSPCTFPYQQTPFDHRDLTWGRIILGSSVNQRHLALIVIASKNSLGRQFELHNAADL